jgi:hypothetical protein
MSRPARSIRQHQADRAGGYRRIRTLGVALHPTGDWTGQQACNLVMNAGDQAGRVKFMIRDRGSDFTTGFDAVLADAGIRTVPCNVRTPRMNTIAERWTVDVAASSRTAPSSGTSPFAADLAAKPKWAERCPRNRSEIPAK